MRTLITNCLLLVTAFSLHAQEKPTREQTLQYLNSVLIGHLGGHYDPSFGRVKKAEFLFEFLQIRLNDKDVSGTGDCTLTYRFKATTRYSGYSVRNIEIAPSEESEDRVEHLNLSKIESFVFHPQRFAKDDVRPINDNVILFYDTPESKGLWARGIYCPPRHAEKVLKALNHLRKLCGAPEPISFD